MQRNKSEIMKYILGLLCSVMLLVACSDKDDKESPAPDKRTVIVYISAENNLNSYYESDLTEMTEGSKDMPKNTNLVAFVDGADKTTLPYIISFKNGQRIIDTEYQVKEDFYASDPQKMYEILSWIMRKYPSESYGLVLWGHASGWIIAQDSVAYDNRTLPIKKAYGIDNGNNSHYGSGKKWMNIPSMADVLERLPMKLSFILADCCNFMGAETVYELRNVADYIIGSPAEIPGEGAPYDKVVPQMFNMSNDFYQGITDAYYSAYNNNVVLSAVKTSAMEQLANATKNIMPELTSKEPATDSLIYYYGGAIKTMFDVKGLVKQNVNESDYNEWLMSLEKAVVYKRIADKWDTMGFVDFRNFTMSEDLYGGLSMFVPMSEYDRYGYSWNKDIAQMEWHYATGMNK